MSLSSGLWSQNVSLGISPRMLDLEALKDCRDLAPEKVSVLRVSSLPTETSITCKYALFLNVPGGKSVKKWKGHSRSSVESGMAGNAVYLSPWHKNWSWCFEIVDISLSAARQLKKYILNYYYPETPKSKCFFSVLKFCEFALLVELNKSFIDTGVCYLWVVIFSHTPDWTIRGQLEFSWVTNNTQFTYTFIWVFWNPSHPKFWSRKLRNILVINQIIILIPPYITNTLS